MTVRAGEIWLKTASVLTIVTGVICALAQSRVDTRHLVVPVRRIEVAESTVIRRHSSPTPAPSTRSWAASCGLGTADVLAVQPTIDDRRASR